MEEHPWARPLPPARGLVEFASVSFRYPGAPRPSLENLSFRVQPGQTLAIIGPSGAGKSTITKLLLRFYDPDVGAIRLDGHDLRDLTLRSPRDNVAVLLQETLVLDGTVRQNIAYGRLGATEEEIIAAAKAADAHGLIVSLDDGYDTLVGQKGGLLSGGERQRLAIARTMVKDAPVLVLDEPTTGLDAESGEKVLGPLRRLMSGRTTILISHDPMAVRSATEIVLLEDGRVAERGSHADLLAREGLYARLFDAHHVAARTVEP